jgi:hypothetical protein
MIRRDIGFASRYSPPLKQRSSAEILRAMKWKKWSDRLSNVSGFVVFYQT